MTVLHKYLWSSFLVLVLGCSGCSEQNNMDLNTILSSRPSGANLVYDQAGIMEDLLESTELSLNTLATRHDIEMLIVVLSSLENRYTISEAAAMLFSQWEIGKEQGGGVLLLLIDDVKEVKLEVGYELEGIYTDLFTGSIERDQLGPRFAAGELEVGLIALMEELEARAEVKRQEDAVADVIAKRDAKYLSGGGGARVELQQPVQAEFDTPVNLEYPAGETVAQAWESMLKKWQDGQRDPNLGVFLPTGRLAYRDFASMPKKRLFSEYQTYRKKQYTVLQDSDYAVVYFGKKKGWDNSPFLFCRTQQGWQFDLVNQRRLIRMGASPSWGIEFGEHPYMELLWDTFRFYGQDIYISREDQYKVAEDAEIARNMLWLEQEVAAHPGDFSPALQLGRLYAITSMSRKAVKTLKKAASIQPDNPEVYAYLALAHVNGVYQYESALKALQKAEASGGKTLFTANLTGYCHYQKKRYKQAAQAFEQGLALADTGYAHYYLAFTYAWLVQKEESRSLKEQYREQLAIHADYVKNHPDMSQVRRKRYLEWRAK